MTLELVDVVNEAGEVIGTVTRGEMRQQRLPHRCVYLLVFNTKGELYIHLRTQTKDVFPSYWDLCAGGVVSAGEDFLTGAKREGREELGVKISPEPLFPFRYEDAKTIVHSVVYRVIHDGPFQLQAEEVVQGEFVPMEKLEARLSQDCFTPDGLCVLAEARRLGVREFIRFRGPRQETVPHHVVPQTLE
ncbi:MAG: NUDIX domain-containing protein [Gemmataceae bacterium]|nr:NUDIX domain-containing protein [Gemmataceae bacterium]